MAAPDIVALAALGVDTAWSLTVSVQADATVKLTPTVTPAADGGSVTRTWAAEVACRVIKYDELEEDKDGGASQEERGSSARRNRTVILVRGADLTGGIPDADTEVTIGADTWKVYEIERVPGDSIFILGCR